jgi:hypothetical protein
MGAPYAEGMRVSMQMENDDVRRGGVVSFVIEFRAEFTRQRAAIVSGADARVARKLR